MTTQRRKYKLITGNLKEHRCEVCGLTEWNNNPIPIELHHKDGDKTNNDINNLQIICPNCHAQTDNYKSKNRSTSKHGRTLSDQELIEVINKSYSTTEVLQYFDAVRSMYLRNKCKSLIEDNKALFLVKPIKKKQYIHKIRIKKDTVQHKCNDCSINITRNKSNKCKKCYHVSRQRIERPNINILIDDIKKLGYKQCGEKYNISDNGIRKWVISAGESPAEIRRFKKTHNMTIDNTKPWLRANLDDAVASRRCCIS